MLKEHYKSITDVKKDSLEHIKRFTKALINSHNSKKVLLELGKDVIWRCYKCKSETRSLKGPEEARLAIDVPKP